jgi:Family of unknown function (DUF6328)
VVLTRAFDLLPAWSKALHALALGLVALCTILLMAPAAYHRTVYAGEAAPELHQLGSKFILVATVALALGLAADVYVVIARIAEKLSGCRRDAGSHRVGRGVAPRTPRSPLAASY